MLMETQLYNTIFDDSFWYSTIGVHDPRIRKKIETAEKDNLSSYLNVALFPTVMSIQQSVSRVIKNTYGRIIADSNNNIIHPEVTPSSDMFDKDSSSRISLDDYKEKDINTINHYDNIYRICSRHGGIVAADVKRYIEENMLAS